MYILVMIRKNGESGGIRYKGANLEVCNLFGMAVTAAGFSTAVGLAPAGGFFVR